MATILVVEDEYAISRLLQDYLKQAGYATRSAADGLSALEAFRLSQPDLIVLDLGLPGKDGLDVIREVRRDHNTPIIIVTARDAEADRIVGLEMGADDYVVKPFSPREVVARVRSVLRRTASDIGPDSVLRVGELEIDVAKMQTRKSGIEIELTATEFQLLTTMARKPGRVFTRGQLLDSVRGVAFEGYERAIDAHIKNLRRKIETEPAQPHYIQTVYGVGYRFAES